MHDFESQLQSTALECRTSRKSYRLSVAFQNFSRCKLSRQPYSFGADFQLPSRLEAHLMFIICRKSKLSSIFVTEKFQFFLNFTVHQEACELWIKRALSLPTLPIPRSTTWPSSLFSGGPVTGWWWWLCLEGPRVCSYSLFCFLLQGLFSFEGQWNILV